jgi:signal transduction histidine kinase
LAVCVAALLGLLAHPGASADANSAPLNVRGLPFTRAYPLAEIGEAPRGARLSFDRFGRLAVVYSGFYAVLNDTVWLDLADKDARNSIGMSNVVHGPDGTAYYGALGSWGIAEFAADGKLRARPLMQTEAPKWALTTELSDVLVTGNGVYFGGRNGVVHWDPSSKTTRFFDISSVSRIFALGDEVFVSTHQQPLYCVDLKHGTLRSIAGMSFGGSAVHLATPLENGRALIALRNGRVFVFDGERVTPWPTLERHGLSGRIVGLQRLIEGGTAVAIAGEGLFLFSQAGELTTALTSPQYHRISDLATREPGVLWVAAEDAVEKVLYGGALTVFGQRLGLNTSWPGVLRWGDRLLVASSGELFEAIPGPPGVASQFRPLDNPPPGGVWAVAARGSSLLVGNTTGAYQRNEDGTYLPVIADMNVSSLVMADPQLCFAIGETEIALLRWSPAGWAECTPRIAGVGFPTVVRASKHAIWIELGANRVGRLTFQDGALNLRLFEDFPWDGPRWVNVGVVDDTAILSGPPGSRLFFDEITERFCDASELDELLNRSPRWITRVQKDDTGTLWATHDQGVVTFTPRGGNHTMDASTFELNNAYFPAVQVLPGNDVWFSAGRSLYHVERHHTAAPNPRQPPVLVSITDEQTSTELLAGADSAGAPLHLPFARNNLSFRFFSGSYSGRRAPTYEFRLNRTERWASLGSGSLLNFPELREGDYQLEVRTGGDTHTAGPATAFHFEILPPWHRTWFAYGLYGFAIGAAFLGLVRWSGHRARRQNLVLEKLVSERTRQLESTMEQLNTETRHAATLAERDRLAGEIHDSLQQGLSGLILQLDATLKLPSAAGDLRSRLEVARNMVSFTRHEVQHAVWDMESPLLEDTELSEALRKLTDLISPGTAIIDIAVSGAPVALPSAIKHHLLRIAQEAITNAVRHATPHRISVALGYQPHSISLAVSDDGVGFRPDDVLSKSFGHFGLRGLRSRAAKLGGTLQIQSEPGQGASIRVVVPLASPSSSSDASDSSV